MRLSIKEPFLKRFGDATLGIRVDHPDDLNYTTPVCAWHNCRISASLGVQMKTCSSCRTAYCSKHCQRMDWLHEHKQKCSFVKPTGTSGRGAACHDGSVLARVEGLTSHPELNGVEVRVLDYRDEKGRYIVQVLKGDGTRTLSLKPANLMLSVGTLIVVAGLTSADLNGRQGVVEGFDEAKGRYKVRIDGDPQPKGIKPENCRASFG